MEKPFLFYSSVPHFKDFRFHYDVELCWWAKKQKMGMKMRIDKN